MDRRPRKDEGIDFGYLFVTKSVVRETRLKDPDTASYSYQVSIAPVYCFRSHPLQRCKIIRSTIQTVSQLAIIFQSFVTNHDITCGSLF